MAVRYDNNSLLLNEEKLLLCCYVARDTHFSAFIAVSANFFSDVYSFTWGSMWCIFSLIIMFGHASTSESIYKTDSLFSASGWRGWVAGIHVPCDGIMAVERCVGYFVILACSRDVWEKFSSGTNNAFRLIVNDGRVKVEISLHTFLGICVWKCSVVGVVSLVSLQWRL